MGSNGAQPPSVTNCCEAERASRVQDVVRRLRFKGPVFEISALTHQGCDALVKAVYQHVHAQQVLEAPPAPVDRRFEAEPPA